MNKVSCNVIRDLLPLYIDEVASDDTRELVNEHISYCDSCREVLQQMAGNVVVPLSREAEQEEIAFITKVKNTIRKKNVRVAVITAIVSVAVIIGAYCVMCLPTRVIPYEEGLINITEEDGKVYAEFAGDNYNGVYMFSETVTVEKNGTEEIVVAMYYEQSLYSKFIEPVIKKNKEFDTLCLNGGYGTTIDGKEVHIKENLQAVYYSPKKIDFKAMEADESWTDSIDEMELIWHE